MAEFKEVLRQADRLCNKQYDCDKCPLSAYQPCCITDIVEDIEEKVMEWAEIHPEPKYPTIKEYLWKQFEEHGIASLTEKGFKIWMESTEIPEEIAEKLGISPLEE